MTLWAAADLGTNTFRLLVAEEVASGRLAFRELHQQVVRLGEGLAESGRLGPAARARAEVLLAAFRARLDALGVGRRVGAVTAAGRAARDGADFARRAGELLGGSVSIRSGEEEARLAAAGGVSLVDARGRPVLFADIGGGSTEVVSLAGDGAAEAAVSLPAGVVSLWEAVRPADPPGRADLLRLQAAAEAAVSALGDAIDGLLWADRLRRGALFLATAGTALTVAAEAHGRSIRDTRALGGLLVGRAEVEAVWRRFSSLGSAGRRALASVETGREDVILPGLALLRALLDRHGAGSMTVTDGGLLEGVLLEAVAKERGEARWVEVSEGAGAPGSERETWLLEGS